MEIWKQISGYSDYEISSLGNIKSLTRIKVFKNGRRVHFDSKLKKLRIHPGNGFLMTDLINDSGIRKTVEWYLNNKAWCENIQNGSYQLERLGVNLK